MAKVKLKMTHKIDFCVAATVEAFGYEAMVAVRKKSVAREHTLSLTTDINDHAEGELEEGQFSSHTDQQGQ